ITLVAAALGRLLAGRGRREQAQPAAAREQRHGRRLGRRPRQGLQQQLTGSIGHGFPPWSSWGATLSECVKSTTRQRAIARSEAMGRHPAENSPVFVPIPAACDLATRHRALRVLTNDKAPIIRARANETSPTRKALPCRGPLRL